MSLIDTPPRHHLATTTAVQGDQETIDFNQDYDNNFMNLSGAKIIDDPSAEFNDIDMDMGIEKDDRQLELMAIVEREIKELDQSAEIDADTTNDTSIAAIMAKYGGELDSTDKIGTGRDSDVATTMMDMDATVGNDTNENGAAGRNQNPNDSNYGLEHIGVEENTNETEGNGEHSFKDASKGTTPHSQSQTRKRNKDNQTQHDDNQSKEISSDVGKLDHNVVEISKMIREAEQCLDDLNRIQIQNAILMDSLVMVGVDF